MQNKRLIYLILSEWSSLGAERCRRPSTSARVSEHAKNRSLHCREETAQLKMPGSMTMCLDGEDEISARKNMVHPHQGRLIWERGMPMKCS